ncbi:RecX family transcriptional regulator [Oceanirhabdus sp. W0125-5]|uniref:RecX family transcriptional regulator n=1 Tax=Oceanirhabdus sp. W0125-5 TaxID=2999116 RepID=UPI0022F30457|nr:RecX family transcriptional regulator [Oceanirhabdus sp. W0125-5]WBW98741.1 RecX family transcriptional regulator [Oceanirhabdus sp. W0125-5]
MEIINIIPHKRFEDKVILQMDNYENYTISLEAVYKYNLKKGKEIHQEEFDKIIIDENYRAAKTKGLKYIERGDKTFAQVCEYLEKKEYSSQVIEKVMEFLVDYDFVNDERYAERYIKERRRTEGKNKIKYALKKKGINEDIISEKLININEDEELEAINKLVNKKIHTLIKDGKDEYFIKNKLYSYIISKGFCGDNVLKSIKQSIMENRDLIYEHQRNNQEKDKENIMEVASKRYSLISKSETNNLKLKKKLYDFLLRKGYSYDDVKSAVNEIISNE